MSGTQPENDGIIPQKSLTVWDGMGKTRNVQKRERVDIKRSGNMEERRESYNNNFKSCFPHIRRPCSFNSYRVFSCSKIPE